MGQNYVNVHPDQKETDRLEYGIATLHIKATDRDGGPVYYQLQARSSADDNGNFSISDDSGAMAYVYDEEDGLYYWQALVSWRPPPGAAEDTEYELKVTVRDEQGLTDSTVSGAGLLPVINTLAPVRMVMETQSKELYLSNIEGGSLVELTVPGEPEERAFFSPDGSRIYSFYKPTGGGEQFRVRNADGSRAHRVLRNFAAGIDLKYDPTYQYVAYLDPGSNITKDYPYKEPKFVPRRGRPNWILEDKVGRKTAKRLEVLHLLADDPPITVSTTANPDTRIYWDARNKHTLVYDQFETKSQITSTPRGSSQVLGPYVPSPGYQNFTRASQLTGYPPQLGTIDPDKTVDASSRSYNPAEERWYVYVDGTTLWLEDRNEPSKRVSLDSGSFLGEVNWASNGQQVVYVKRQGASNKVVVKHVLEPDLTLRSRITTRFEYSAPGLHNAQLAPTGKWVFFLEGTKLYRAVNSRGASKVNLSENLGKSLDSYVVSP